MGFELQLYQQISAASRSSQKLAKKYFVPQGIIQRIGQVAYKLELPSESRIHPTFHISPLKLCPNPSVKQCRPPIDWPDPSPNLVLENILKKRMGRRWGRIITEVFSQMKRLAGFHSFRCKNSIPLLLSQTIEVKGSFFLGPGGIDV